MKVVLGLVVVVVVMVMVMMVRADSEGDSVKVELTQGVVEGVALPTGGTDSNRVYYSFRGIPYAKPPLGKLRFKDPVPAEGWEGIRAPFNPPPCPQLDLIGFFQQKFSPVGEEDCLYLHVYTPKVGETDSPLPVMVYIHGGGFLFGEGDTAGGSALPLLTKDVVLVSLQYRLGALGFISTEDSALPGNMGLRDQTQAFRWVQHNIHSFGGDPDRVTIFGESAGAAAVHFQILSPEAEGLFHRAILQSGTTLNPWALRHDHKQSAISVGKKLGCLGADDDDVEGEALLECLQEIPAGQIVAVGSMSTTEMPFMMFVPRVDGEFLPSHPASLLATGRYNKVDLISGVNKHEGAMSMPGMVMKLSAEGGITVGDLVPIAPDIFGLTQEEGGGKDLAIRALYHYLGDDNTKLTLHPDTTDIMVKMLSDATFIVQHEDIARLHTRDSAYNNSIYLYQLDHRAPITFSTLLGLTIENEWVCHADELQYLFTNVFGFMTLERSLEQVLSDVMVTLWTSFAATGNPTPDMSLGFRWLRASSSNLQYLSLTPAARMMPEPKDKDREFLRSLPTLQQRLLHPEAFNPDSSTSSSQSQSSPEHEVDTQASCSCCTLLLGVFIFFVSLAFLFGFSPSSTSSSSSSTSTSTSPSTSSPSTSSPSKSGSSPSTE